MRFRISLSLSLLWKSRPCLRGQDTVLSMQAIPVSTERRVAGSGNRGHVSSEGPRGSWGVALRFTGKGSQVFHRSVDSASPNNFVARAWCAGPC